MMTINDKNKERNDRGRCLGGLLLTMALVMEFLVDIKYIIHCRKKKKKDKFKFSHQQSTFSGQFKMEINRHLVKDLGTKNFNFLFSLTIVIFPLGQYYISFRRLTGFHLHRDYLPGSKVSYQGGLMFTPKCMIIYPLLVKTA